MSGVCGKKFRVLELKNKARALLSSSRLQLLEYSERRRLKHSAYHKIYQIYQI